MYSAFKNLAIREIFTTMETNKSHECFLVLLYGGSNPAVNNGNSRIIFEIC